MYADVSHANVATIHAVQTLRARLFLVEGAITEKNLCEGRHDLAADWTGHHVTVKTQDNALVGFLRINFFQLHEVDQLSIVKSTLVMEQVGESVRKAIKQDVSTLAYGQYFAELGSLAIEPEYRNSRAFILLVNKALEYARRRGTRYAISYTTTSKGVDRLMERLGAQRIGHEFYDPHHQCFMQVFRFAIEHIKIPFSSSVH